ncbi:MAG: MFS transporter [Dehalococcoidia bacterium]
MAALAATGHLTLPVLFGLTALLGLVTALDNPTRQAFQTELVPETETHNAIALSNIQLNAARIVGPTLSALLALIGPVAASLPTRSATR